MIKYEFYLEMRKFYKCLDKLRVVIKKELKILYKGYVLYTVN